MKRGYFFTLDAFMAIGILSIGLFLLYLSQSFTPSTAQAGLLSEDLLSTLGSTRIEQLNNDFVREERQSGNITNPQNTLLEQIGEYRYRAMMGNARNFTQNVTANLVPVQFGYDLRIDGQMLANRSILGDETGSVNIARTLIIGVINRTVLWGPYSVEVRVWQ